jgi:glycine/D-amino acid oxidase-like deaminating enzyme/nitrite reductase/ring-hydroxylating ferredoxin subunit
METGKSANPKITSGKNISFWMDSVEPISFESLKENLETDVVIVGGGIAGISVAYSLIAAGKKVVLVEDGNIGSGETGRTTAHLVCALDDRYYELERIYGEDEIKNIADSHKAAIDFIERTINHEKIECDFERLDGYLFLHPTDKKESLGKEFISARKAGIEVVELPVMPGMKEVASCLKFSDQAQFHPMKYLAGLCNVLKSKGAKIYTSTKAAKIDHTGIVTQDGFTVKAGFVVVATNTPVNNKYVMHLKQYAYRSYVIGARVKKGSVPKALWWDTGDFSQNAEIPPYHYVRTQKLDNEYDLLICGGEDHAVGLAEENKINEEDRYGILENWLRKRFDIVDLVYQWSGQVMEPMDSLGYIGHNPRDEKNVFIVTGDSGNGMTHGVIAGILITDLITGKENPWEKIYDPSRFKIFSAGKTYFKELMGGMLNYLKQKPKDAKSVELQSIKPRQGKIVEIDGKKFGVYRDDKDLFHMVGAECTHMKCIIKWNNDEQSWDCPCHGSRFNVEGRVLNGPANENLSYYNDGDNQNKK